MNIKIYQIDMERDTDCITFCGLEALMERKGDTKPDAEIYDAVYSGEVDCSSLEDVYRMFNLNHPAGYCGRSLSVSDIVEVKSAESIEPGFYFCDNFGFQKVAFEPPKQEQSKTMRVLFVEPGKLAREAFIGTTLEDMQAAVEGDIEQFMPFEDEIAIVCNEEGKMNGMPLNRAVYAEPMDAERGGMLERGSLKDGTKEMVDIIAGKFFVCAAPSESEHFQGLSDEQMKKYMALFRYPEQFFRINREIQAIQYHPKKNQNMER